MKIIKLLILLLLFVLISGGAWFYSLSYGERWLFMNKRVAEGYASALLKGNVNYKTPDRFIDYVVAAEEGYVLFSNHAQPSRIFGYFPKSPPETSSDNVSKLSWEKLDENWYQMK